MKPLSHFNGKREEERRVLVSSGFDPFGKKNKGGEWFGFLHRRAGERGEGKHAASIFLKKETQREEKTPRKKIFSPKGGVREGKKREKAEPKAVTFTKREKKKGVIPSESPPPLKEKGYNPIHESEKEERGERRTLKRRSYLCFRKGEGKEKRKGLAKNEPVHVPGRKRGKTRPKNPGEKKMPPSVGNVKKGQISWSQTGEGGGGERKKKTISPFQGGGKIIVARLKGIRGEGISNRRWRRECPPWEKRGMSFRRGEKKVSAKGQALAKKGISLRANRKGKTT